MKLTTLADILGSASAEAALLHLYHYGESYGRAVAADFGVSLDSVQKQLRMIRVCINIGTTIPPFQDFQDFS